MKPYIHKDEYLPYAPDKPGSIRINHNSGFCVGESDSLMITRKSDGTVSAYCFRCAGTGYYSAGRNFYIPESSSEEPVEITGGYSLPADATATYVHFGHEARAWLTKAGITAEAAERRGMWWSEERATLYLPVEQEISAFGPKLVGYVLRRFSPKRYLTLTNDKAGFWGLYRASERHPGEEGRVVLVEDVISALRSSEVCDSLCLCGTELRPGIISALIQENYKEAVVFLDGDNPTVKMKARKIGQRLSWMKVRIVETGRDPKLYSTDELRKLIMEVSDENA